MDSGRVARRKRCGLHRFCFGGFLTITVLAVVLTACFVTMDESDATEIEIGEVRYSVSGSTASVIGYTGYPTSLEIPSAIIFEDMKYPVISIGDSAFRGCFSLRFIEIPKTVESIKKSAFEGCSSLKSLTIPESLTSIEKSAFEGCFSLKSLTIPESLTCIDSYALHGCSLEAINVDENNPKFCSIDGVLFDKSGTSLIKYPASKTDSKYDVPESVKEIQKYAFDGCDSLETVVIANSVDSIGYFAFQNCTSMRFVYIPDSVTSIRGNAFANCTSLISVSIPASVTSMGSYVFDDCNSLEYIYVDPSNPEFCSIDGVLYDKAVSKLIQYPAGRTDSEYTIPNSVWDVSTSSFGGCEYLTAINVDESTGYLRSIDGVLYNGTMTRLFLYPAGKTDSEYTLPVSVNVGPQSGAFDGCKNLVSINVEEGSVHYTSVDGVLYSKNAAELIKYPAGKIDSEYTIPSDTAFIRQGAFEGCKYLTAIIVEESNTKFSSVNGVLFNKDGTELIVYPAGKADTQYIVPGTTTVICNSAFDNALLEIIEFSDNAAVRIQSSAFLDCSSLKTIKINEGAVTGFDFHSICFSDKVEHTIQVDASDDTVISDAALNGIVKLVYISDPTEPGDKDSSDSEDNSVDSEDSEFPIMQVVGAVVIVALAGCAFIFIRRI